MLEKYKQELKKLLVTGRYSKTTVRDRIIKVEAFIEWCKNNNKEIAQESVFDFLAEKNYKTSSKATIIEVL